MGPGRRSVYGPARRKSGFARRLLTLVAACAVVIETIGPITGHVSAALAAANVGSGAPPTGGPVSPIDYIEPTAGGGDATQVAADPSIQKRPSLKVAQPPQQRAAVPANWTANRQVWANPDGTFEVDAGQNINFKNDAGAWTAVDLTLQPDANGKYHAAAAPGQATLDPSAGDSGFATLTGLDGAVTLRTLGYGAGGKLGNQVRFVGSNGAPDVFVNPTDTGFEFGATFAAANVGPGANFVLDPGVLTPTLASDGSLTFSNGFDSNGKPVVVGVIGAPSLYDGAEQFADPSTISVTLTARGDGTYLLSYTVAASWLHAQGRVFPVTLDPQACIRTGGTTCDINSPATNMNDTFYGNASPTTPVTSANFGHIGHYVATSDNWGIARSEVYFDGVSLPDGAAITSATLSVVESDNYSGTTTQNIYARMANGTGWTFGNSTSTWNALNAAVTSGYDSPTIHPCSSGATDCTLSFDVSRMVRAWYTRTPTDWRPNVGVQLRYDSTGESNSVDEVAFYRHTNGTAQNRPLLRINYELGAAAINFDPTLGQTYAPSTMVSGVATILPIKVTNNTTFAFDTTNYRVGYRFFDVKGNNISSGVGALPSGGVAANTTSAVFGLTVTPPAVGQYTLRLDVVRLQTIGGTTYNIYYSDWAQPHLYYSRNKSVLTSDSTRWTGSSLIERDEFGIKVTNGQNPADPKSVDWAGGQVGIDLATHNLSFDGDSGISVNDTIPLNLTYGYNSKDAADGCSGYLGILAACGWFTNFDERVVAGATDGAYTYFGADGNSYLTDSDYDGQLVGAPNQLSRSRVTLFDENRPTSGGATLVLTSGESPAVPNLSGTHILKMASNTQTTLAGFVDGAAGREVSLNAFRYVSFSMRTTAAASTAICFTVENKTKAIIHDLCATVGADWNPGGDYVGWSGDTVLTNWDSLGFDLWGIVSGTLGGGTNFGGITDDYFLKAVYVKSPSGSTGSTYVDALVLTPQRIWTMGSASVTNWTSGSSTSSSDSPDTTLNSLKLTSAARCDNVAGSTSCINAWGITENVNGSNFQPLGSLQAAPFFSWWWKKSGGTVATMTLTFTDLRTSATGTITYYAGSAPPAGAVNPVQISPHIPGTWTRVVRNVLEDARTVLNFYKDDDTGTTSTIPPTQGPTADNVQWTGFTVDPVDGQYVLLLRPSLNSISLPADMNRYADWSYNQDLLNYSGIKDASGNGQDDFVAEMADGSSHFFNRDGLLTRIVSKDGAELDLDWTYASSGTGPSAYTLTAIHAPSDKTDDGAGTTFRHYLSVTSSSPTGFKETSFTEKLGTVAAPVTGRTAAFFVATSTGTTWGVGDLVQVSPARNNVADPNKCTGSPVSCVGFEYTSTTSHLIRRIADPRYDPSSAPNARLTVTWSADPTGDPTALQDMSHSNATLLSELSQNHSGTLYTRPLWQDASAAVASYAMHEDLSPDGTPVATYIRQACASGSCATSGNWPAGDDTTLGTRRATVMAYDGVLVISSTTTYRCPGVAVDGCTGTVLASVERSATNAAAKVENYIDVLTSGEVMWSQTADQYFASLRDSAGTNPDLYRTDFSYNGTGSPIVTQTPEFDRVTDYAGTMLSTDGLTDYWRMNDASSPLANIAPGGSSHTASGTSLGFGQSGQLARDSSNRAISFNGTTNVATAASTAVNSTGYTLEAWVKVGASNQTSKGIAGRWLSNVGAMLELDQYGSFALVHNATTIAAPAGARLIPVVGRWYYVVGTWDGAQGRLYVDGDLIAQGAATGSPSGGSAQFQIAAYGNGAAGSFLNATIDEVAVHNMPVDLSVIRAHLAAARGVALTQVQTTYGWPNYSSNHHLDILPRQVATNLVTNGDFEAGLGSWSINHGAAVIAGHSPYDNGSTILKIVGAAYTEQLAQAVPGQRVHFQVYRAPITAGASATITLSYWQVSTQSWTTLVTNSQTSLGQWAAQAYEYTVPATDTTGLLKVTLSNGAGTGEADFEGALVLTDWSSYIYRNHIDFSTAGTAYIGDGLLWYKEVRVSSFSIFDKLFYDANASAAEIFPTSVDANDIFDYYTGYPDEDVITTTSYDAWGRPLVVTDPDGVATTTTYAANQTDVATVTKGAGQPPTSMAYDQVGNVTSVTSPSGRVTSTAYDYLNHITAVVAPDGTKQQTDYDNAGQPIRQWANYVNGVVESTDGDLTDDVLTVLAYDAYGRVTRRDVDCGSYSACSTGGLDARTTTSYDAVGNVVSTTTYPGAGGTGTARTTTNYFETYTYNSVLYSRLTASGVRAAIAPSSSPAPTCPGDTVVCSTAATWKWNPSGSYVSGVDMNGRQYAMTDAYGITTLTDFDLDGRPVGVTSNFVAAGTSTVSQNVMARTEYGMSGVPIAIWDVAGRETVNSYDALDRLISAAHYGNDHPATLGVTTSTVFLPSGRVDRTNDGASWTKTVYDSAGRAVETIANYDPAGSAPMTIDAFEGPLSSNWSTATTSWFILNVAPSMSLDTNAAGNSYTNVAPVSGRGRLHFTTSASSAADGVWLNLTPTVPPATFKAGHTYAATFDFVASQAGISFTAFLGQDAFGGSYGTTSISSPTTWTSKTVTWTPTTDQTSVHFAVHKDGTGTTDAYLDNLVVYDTTANFTDSGIVSSLTAYDADGRVMASVLPPGNPATEHPLVTTVAFDAPGRPVATTVNGPSGAYVATVKATGNLAAYFPLDEVTGSSWGDVQGGGALQASGAPLAGVAGGVDEARTALRLDTTGAYLYRATNATTATTNVSMEAWIRTDTTPTDGSSHIIAFNGNATNGWGLSVNPSGKASGFVAAAGTTTALASSIGVTDGAWHHLVLVRDTTTWSMYVDGVAASLANNTTSPGTPAANFDIGTLSDGTRKFVGDIDEVAVYTANLGSSVAAHFAAGRLTDSNTGLTTRTSYDDLGRTVDTWSPDLTRTHAGYDRLGDRTDTWLDYHDGVTIGAAPWDDDVRSTYAYDVAGELTGYCPAAQVYSASCNPANSADATAWHYTFDQMGRQVTTVPPVNGTNTKLNMTESVYETGGRLAKTCSYIAYPTPQSCGSTNSRHTNYGYDPLNRVTSQTSYSNTTGTDTVVLTKTLTWNADGTQNSIGDGTQTFNWTYDPFGRMAQFKDGSTVLTAYTYNVTTGTVATRTDGTLGTTTFGYDWANRETSITPPASFGGGYIGRTYRLDGTLATQAFPSSVTETLTYDADKRPIQLALNTAGTNSWFGQSYDRTAKVTTEGRSLTGIAGDPGTGTQTFTYDHLSRVTGSTGLSNSYAYAYDLSSDRLTRTDGSTATTFAYDLTGQISGQTIGVTQKAYAYDAFGNLTTAYDSSSQSIAYANDQMSRLTGVSPQTGSAATFTVDALDRPKARTVGGTQTDVYGYLGPSTTSYETGNATKTDALLDLDGSKLALKTGSTVDWVIFDLHGSVAALCPAGSTTLSDAYRYDAWGQQMTSGSTVNPWRYRGLLDVSPNPTQLLANGARFYSPQLGAFTAEDTTQGNAVDPTSMNRYLYAEGNPATLIDPDGHAVQTTLLGGCSYGYEDCTATGVNWTTSRSSSGINYLRQKSYALHLKSSAPSAPVSGPRLRVATSTAGCAACADVTFSTGGNSLEVATDQAHAQARSWSNEPPSHQIARLLQWYLSAIAMVGGGLEGMTVWGAAEQACPGHGSQCLLLVGALSRGRAVEDAAGGEADDLAAAFQAKAVDAILEGEAAERRAEILDAFEGEAVGFTSFEPEYLYRYSNLPGSAGSWLSTTLYSSPEEARAALALPAGNTAQYVSLVKVDPGDMLLGTVKGQTDNPLFGSYATGGGEQVFVEDRASVTFVQQLGWAQP